MQAPMPVSGWQVGSTVATAAAALIALVAVLVNIYQRRQERADDRRREQRKAEAQARLVGTGLGNPGVDAHPDDANTRSIVMPVDNRSDRPIRKVIAEHWPADRKLTEQPGSVIEMLMMPGDSTTFYVPVNEMTEPEPKTRAWRVRWTDADGDEWCWDRYPQDTPDRYTGQPPTPY